MIIIIIIIRVHKRQNHRFLNNTNDGEDDDGYFYAFAHSLASLVCQKVRACVTVTSET